MSRIKRITSDQFLVLAALGMPVYSSSEWGLEAEDGGNALMGFLKSEHIQSRERRNAEDFVKEYDIFYTLVEEE